MIHKQSVSLKRYGFTIIELLYVIVFLYLAFWILCCSARRAVEIVATVTGEQQNNVFVVSVFLLILIFCIGIAVSIYRLRMWYGNLLYFPLMVGLPLGFAAVPFRPFSLPVYASLLVMAIIITPLVFFFIQSVFLLLVTSYRKRNPIPEVLPPFTAGSTPHRSKPISNIKDLPPHPNVTQAWADYHNSVGIHHDYATEAYLCDHCIDEFRVQLSLHCQKLLLHYKQPSGYIRFWSRETSHLEEMVKPCAALDFGGGQDWAEYVRETLSANSYILSQRDERLVRMMCAVFLNNDDELERMNQELRKPIGWVDRMITRERKYWKTLLAGIVECNVEHCQEAIRIQAEEWYIPSLSNYHRLNINGVAMTNLCRWRGIPVPALEPVIPESLLLQLQ